MGKCIPIKKLSTLDLHPYAHTVECAVHCMEFEMCYHKWLPHGLHNGAMESCLHTSYTTHATKNEVHLKQDASMERFVLPGDTAFHSWTAWSGSRAPGHQPGMPRHGADTWQATERQSTAHRTGARNYKARHGMTHIPMARDGTARHGTRGAPWHGMARRGTVSN